MRSIARTLLIVVFSTLVVFSFQSCKKNPPLFELIDPSRSGIVFNNVITENDSMNILDYEYLYNGGGVGIGDFNNDGLEDVFLTGNMVDNKLYLNKGDFRFEDISETAGITAPDKWSSGVAVVDINGDGWKDVYVCHNTLDDPKIRENSLFINQGLNEDGIPVFKNEAADYGLADDSYSVNSAFFDFDNDGDLDVIVIINEMQETRFPGRYDVKKKKKTNYQRIDKLFRNDFDNEKGHPVFTDVSEEAGINIPGFSLGVNITDINKDGWRDIYITNDFLSNDILYINQKDGTFTDKSKEYFKHTSYSAMGNDVVDINNDGYADIIALDMLPEGNYRQKKLLGPNNYTSYINNDRYGFIYQFVRNTLQLNNGQFDNGEEVNFSDISLFSGVSSTDWSWTPLVADFDLDQFRDIIITNGFPKDVTDMDFIDYKADNYTFAPKSMMLSKIPSVKAMNYAYRNNRNLTFEDVTETWGMDQHSYSNGAAYADLDNDGDLDVIVNNIDDIAFVYRNHAMDKSSNHYLKLKLKGEKGNPEAFGSRITVRLDSTQLYYEHSPYRGYLSTHSPVMHVGLGKTEVIKEVEIVWPDNTVSVLKDVAADQLLEVEYSNGTRLNENAPFVAGTIFAGRPDFDHSHMDHDFIDFNIQPLLPHKLSQYGPSLSVVDVNADGWDDIYVSGSAFIKGYFLLQGADGQFTVDTFENNEPKAEEQGVVFFDADNDGDKDMMVASGSFEFSLNDLALQDKIFENKGGTFEYVPGALPLYSASSSCVRAADWDRDGDIDLFVGGRVIPGDYPLPATSYLLENVSKSGIIQFRNANEDKLPQLEEIGLVSDALWSDFDNDGWVDLILACELSPLRFFKNDGGAFSEVVPAGIENHKGFWNSITGVDLDRDGDIDYILGNQGQNVFYEINEKYPYRIYVKDFDNNGSMDALPFIFNKDIDGNIRQFPFMSRMDFAKEINITRKMYPSYESYARADLHTIITDSTLALTDVYEVNYLPSSIAYNLGNGQWKMVALPDMAQLAPVFGTVAEDFTGDGKTDILLIGNDFGNEIFYGRMDALNGLLLQQLPDGSFLPQPASKSGFYVPGDGKSLVTLYHNNDRYVVAGENNGKIRLFEQPGQGMVFIPGDNDFRVSIEGPSGSYIREIYYGNGFLSQSSRKIMLAEGEKISEVMNFGGQKRNANDEVQ